MAGMKRFVTYIYAYEDGKKGSNAGFAKIEIRGADCRIEIHLRGVYAWRAVGRVYLFRKAGEQMEGVQIGEIRPVNGSGNLATIVKSEKIGDSPYDIGEMEGIFILSEDDRIFMSRWREGEPFEVIRERFIEWKPKAAASVQPPELDPESARPSQGQDIPAGETAEQVAPQPVPQQNDSQSAEEVVQATEIPMRNILPGYDWQSIWETLTESHPLFTPFDDRETVCIQLELRELRDLPRRYWYLGNNSFLLHGFFNYRYLVVGRTSENRWFLGVPGIYQRQERVMAAIFGFPEFIPTAAAEEEEVAGEPVNRFGCWYRYIEE